MDITLVIDPDTRDSKEFTFTDAVLEDGAIQDIIWVDFTRELHPSDSKQGKAFSQQDRYERESDVIPTLFLNSAVIAPHYVSIIRGTLYVSVQTIGR